MEQVFVDTVHWIAFIYPRDNLHARAKEWAKVCDKHQLVTTDAVLGELETFFAEKGPELRTMVSAYVQELENDPNLTVLPGSREVTRKARKLYADRPDKGYSSVDCNSMVVMKERGIRLVLTYDQHFEQEGLVALLRKEPKHASSYF
jgi:predicted nucleic acid-binding protein